MGHGDELSGRPIATSIHLGCPVITADRSGARNNGVHLNVQRGELESRERWLTDWRYFATKDDVRVPQFPDPVRGLQLPKTVVEKIYRQNAERFFNHSWKE